VLNRVFAVRLVQWLGWVFETQRKKERKRKREYNWRSSLIFLWFSIKQYYLSIKVPNTSIYNGEILGWFWKSGWLIHKSALCTRIALLHQWGPTSHKCLQRLYELTNSKKNWVSKSVLYDMTAKTFFERLYLVPGLSPFEPPVKCPCAPTPPPFVNNYFSINPFSQRTRDLVKEIPCHKGQGILWWRFLVTKDKGSCDGLESGCPGNNYLWNTHHENEFRFQTLKHFLKATEFESRWTQMVAQPEHRGSRIVAHEKGELDWNDDDCCYFSGYKKWLSTPDWESMRSDLLLIKQDLSNDASSTWIIVFRLHSIKNAQLLTVLIVCCGSRRKHDEHAAAQLAARNEHRNSLASASVQTS